MPNRNELKAIKINSNEKFEIIDFNTQKFGDLNFTNNIFHPNKATKYELTSHGSVIDTQGLIKVYISNFSNLNMFKQKTGEKIREYCVDILVDASNIIKNYSIDHCFLSIVSLLDAVKEIEIPFVNLVIVGSTIIPLLVNQNLKYLTKSDALYSKIYSILVEKSSETRELNKGLKYLISHSIGNSISRVMFIITDAILGNKQENKIKNLITLIQISGTTVIGIGTGPLPNRIKDIFSWSIWALNPYNLRKALLQLSQSPIINDEFKLSSYIQMKKIAPKLPDFRSQIENSEILKQFSELKFITTETYIYTTINEKAFDLNSLDGNYLTDDDYDAYKNNSFNGYHVLVLMFYQGKKGTCDESITKEAFIKGPHGMPANLKSPGKKLKKKGFTYEIATTYRDALRELISGKYCIVMLCTASKGENLNNEDQNYFKSFLDAISQFHQYGGALILFGENPPFIFEINCILKKLPNIKVRLDSNFRSVDPGGENMKPSKTEEIQPGEFLNCKFKFKAKINGIENEFRPFSGGIDELFEGKTLAKFINLDKDPSFKIFSKTHSGEPSCIFKIPDNEEGVIFIDTAGSKLYNEYTKRGAARYISNMVCSCIHYSNLRNSYCNNNSNETGIKINVEVKDTPMYIFRERIDINPPLIISIIIDATGSMLGILNNCYKLLKKLFTECKMKADIEIYLQCIYYRDLSETGTKMCDGSGIRSDPNDVKNFISGVWAHYGGNDGPENMSIGFEKALDEVENFEKKCRNVFILIGDAPNQDPTIPGRFPNGNDRGETWETVWTNIDRRMKDNYIDQLITISCGKEFEKQFDIWNNYNCLYLNSILQKYKLVDYQSFEDIFVTHVSGNVSSMYSSK